MSIWSTSLRRILKEGIVTAVKAKLVSKKEAAEILGVSVRSVERMVASGQLEKVYVRGCVRIRLRDIQSLVGEESY